MECERLIKLVKNWYLQVKAEALAPARMVAFMEKHVDSCPVCMVDDGVRQEVDRITRIILPPSKVPKITAEIEEGEAAFAGDDEDTDRDERDDVEEEVIDEEDEDSEDKDEEDDLEDELEPDDEDDLD